MVPDYSQRGCLPQAFCASGAGKGAGHKAPVAWNLFRAVSHTEPRRARRKAECGIYSAQFLTQSHGEHGERRNVEFIRRSFSHRATENTEKGGMWNLFGAVSHTEPRRARRKAECGIYSAQFLTQSHGEHGERRNVEFIPRSFYHKDPESTETGGMWNLFSAVSNTEPRRTRRKAECVIYSAQFLTQSHGEHGVRRNAEWLLPG